MQKTIKAMETKYLQPSLEMIEDVFTKWDSPEEGKTVRSLVEEIRSKKFPCIMTAWKIRKGSVGQRSWGFLVGLTGLCLCALPGQKIRPPVCSCCGGVKHKA